MPFARRLVTTAVSQGTPEESVVVEDFSDCSSAAASAIVSWQSSVGIHQGGEKRNCTARGYKAASEVVMLAHKKTWPRLD